MLYQDPPVVYSGSLGKLDFGDEGDTKGFYLVEISKENGCRQTRASFQPLKGREFISVKVEIKDWDEDPTATIIQTIRAKEVAGNIVRLHLVIPEHLLHFLREDEILGLLKEAHYFTLSREIIRKKRPAHLPLVESLTPLEVLKTYLDNKEAEPERSKIILDYAQNLILEEMARDEGTSL
jgi:exonuclease SbcD